MLGHMSTHAATARALDLLAKGVSQVERATRALAGIDLAPGHAAYFAWLTERCAAELARSQIHAADALRSSGAHQLDERSLQAVAEAGPAPTLETLEQLSGQRASGRAHFTDCTSMYTSWLQVPVSAANYRLAQADALIARVTEDGVRHGPGYPRLSAEFSGRETDPGLVALAASKLRGVHKDLPSAAQRDQLEGQAATLLRQEPATALTHLGTLVQEQVGTQRPPQALVAEAGIFRKGMRNGLVIYQLKVLPHEAELIESLRTQIDNPATIAGNRQQLAQLTARTYAQAGGGASSNSAPEPGAVPAPPPATTPWDDPETMPRWAQDGAPEEHGSPAENSGDQSAAHAGPGNAESGAPAPADHAAAPAGLPSDSFYPQTFEDLTPAMRHLTALLSALRSTGATGKKTTGIVTPQVVVHLDFAKMIAGDKSYAITENGIPLSDAEARTQMCNAGILPVVFNGKGQILDVGRSERLFPPHMKRALIARDRGCLYPGCTMPAGRCEADHLLPWEEGGETSVENGAMFCPRHHHARHAGLFKVIIRKDRPPAVLLPRSLDPPQLPRRNTYWLSPAEVLDSHPG
ncbi:hypothetical protein CQ010_09675 [Arthrobacter sp. MYb211]|nr:hypothetical protein CQ015_10465 [Arthrobacter sp. MYb221]PRC07535.1 hypothetical protein CQ010_09675 [Arthrobacter sp. MYb211]